MKDDFSPQSLYTALEAAKTLIWKRIQAGNWHADKEAIAAMKTYQHLIKAMEETESLTQLPLPMNAREEKK